jgi:hypothetical protein
MEDKEKGDRNTYQRQMLALIVSTSSSSSYLLICFTYLFYSAELSGCKATALLLIFIIYVLQSEAFAKLGGEECMFDIVYPGILALLGALLA